MAEGRGVWELVRARPGEGSGSFSQGRWELLKGYEQERFWGAMGSAGRRVRSPVTNLTTIQRLGAMIHRHLPQLRTQWVPKPWPHCPRPHPAQGPAGSRTRASPGLQGPALELDPFCAPTKCQAQLGASPLGGSPAYHDGPLGGPWDVGLYGARAVGTQAKGWASGSVRP